MDVAENFLNHAYDLRDVTHEVLQAYFNINRSYWCLNLKKWQKIGIFGYKIFFGLYFDNNFFTIEYFKNVFYAFKSANGIDICLRIDHCSIQGSLE